MSVKLLTNAEKQERKIKNVGTYNGLKECVSLTVDDGEICLEIPFVGNICIPLPSVPDGTIAEACIEFSFPACVKITVTVLGNVVFEEKFGICL